MRKLEQKNFTEVSPDKVSRQRRADTFTCCPVPLTRKISGEAFVSVSNLQCWTGPGALAGRLGIPSVNGS